MTINENHLNAKTKFFDFNKFSIFEENRCIIFAYIPPLGSSLVITKTAVRRMVTQLYNNRLIIS
ncbi:hypothetical protein BpHYR1_052318 [Brachionus plicatilis]|uniref:Uncharacterized protein n=1 Tax=Brachionus plicatilis TaxID=10195 RepID=A0A3M7T333_BRAPC|nr:hypothetical protein BpHYR1_052318 [Brachionus plicatilis]